MGNQGSVVGDEDPSSPTTQAVRSLAHFDHSFKASLLASHGPHFSTFGEVKYGALSRELQITCQASSFELLQDALHASERKKVAISYSEISEIGWDHANSEVKFIVKRPDTEDSNVILSIPSTVEFEHELKLRLTGISQSNGGFKMPSFNYVGMFAGSTKPKPFQRKRPNLSNLPAGKLPKLQIMRQIAVDNHNGSYAPCPAGHSRRMDLALQHIYDGHNTFPVTYVKGDANVANKWCMDSLLLITESTMEFLPRGNNSNVIAIHFDNITSWDVVDNETKRQNDSGINIYRKDGLHHYFGFKYIRDVKHTLEFFWNKYQVARGRPVKPGSTHGRPIVSIYTLAGEVAAPPPPEGNLDIVDQDGSHVRPGSMIKPGNKQSLSLKGGQGRRTSLNLSSVISSDEMIPLPPVNQAVQKHWKDIIVHQGWLLKQGGMGLSGKQWIKRYFVLYSTSQGHFLIYYSDLTEIPLYTSEKNHRNIVDLAKATFLRPGSNKSESADTPPHCFDIVTTEREWTLCAETQDNATRWLKMLTRCVDEDVAILPDENLEFKVKCKIDALGVFSQTDYNTTIRVSANAVTASAPDPPDSLTGEKERCFWVYTDFYKWSLLSQNGKIALLVNVFTDATFQRRHEFVFRCKEAVRLATAIEYFIEKFMTVMHIRLEVDDGTGAPAGGQHEEAGQLRHAEDWVDEVVPPPAPQTEEIDLLGFDNDLPSPPPPPQQSSTNDFFSSGPSTTTTSPPKQQVDLFSDDPFGFGSTPASPPAPTGKAPPLTSAQLAQHATWLRTAILANGGPIYDDGSLQIAAKLEIRLSQGRLTLSYRNISSSTLSNFSLKLGGDSGLVRFEAGSVNATVPPGEQGHLQVMMECMKPAYPGPNLLIEYQDPAKGSRQETISLPVLLTTFNEPITLAAQDFSQRWGMLTGPGQEAQEVIQASTKLTPDQIKQALTSGLKFFYVAGLPDSSDTVLYGAASLRTGATNPNGEKISVGCLIKIELNLNANALRVTTRTVAASATTALLASAKSLLQ